MSFPDLAGKVAVVTGGARGIGYSLATALARAGVRVALLDLLPEVEESAARLASETGARTAAALVDVTDADSVERAFAAVREELGVADLLVTAAGITIWGDSTEVDPGTWAKVVDVNLSGTFYCTQAFARPLRAEGREGSAILISSMSGRVVNVPQHQASYNASKAAVDQLAKSLAVEWAPAIRVNAIAPGYILSDMTRQFTEANPELAADWVSMIPAGRMGVPADLDGLLLLLASSASSYLTGQTLVIDGGYTAI
ncbi:SDR family oxidoreductase [Microbacterium sp. SSW1-47]|uniref:SDR family oxidoreductase n=1 Tax=Microbacterium TaxID=33882 RepID=UPI00109B8D0A|nr:MULTISPECIES: SDR family oxidoreductase [Microbacterium]MBN6190845.1 SDR family oxidoreductase [Aneurinibacillus sp. BA2021]MCK2026303.1 SDR family oxidoreductase [Microbacterium sufflavum]MPS75860.1 SDR family oxidoreductase [Microbacterium sp.]